MKRRENLVSHEEASPIIVRVILSPPIKTNEQMKIRDANIRKENAYIKLRGQFSFLPNKLLLTTEKPNQVKTFVVNAYINPKQAKKEDFFSDSDMSLKAKISQLNYFPKQKYDFPMTASQDVGWFADQQISTKRYRKNSCPETRYALEYYQTSKKHVFSRALK